MQICSQEPMMGFVAGHLAETHFKPPLQPPAVADLLCSTNYSSAAPTAYIHDQLSHFRPAADIICSPENIIIDDHPQFNRDHLCHYSCALDHVSQSTQRVQEGGMTGAEKRSGAKQSMAARERRRKITAKTQELGKLIPGAHKMNTAQMLQAASKYVKFLQAQLALLQQMASWNHQAGKQKAEEELPMLLASPAIQEKLYTEEKCLAPKQFLKKLASIQAVDLQVL